MAHEYAQEIWDGLLADIKNEYGVAALMGNLQAESGLCPYRLQGDFTDGYTTSKSYTAQVNLGEISKDDFIYNGPNGGGYGLAQWTFWSRKKALYEMWQSGGYLSIGSCDLAIAYLLWELKNNYSGVYSTLKNATSIRTASDSVLHNFENPADQSESVEELRASLGQNWYNTFHGSGGGGDTGGDTGDENEPIPYTPRKKMSLLLMYLATRKG